MADRGTLRFRIAESPADRASVVRLREQVYVQDQGRLADVSDTKSTFDRFDRYADYILAEEDGKAIGTIKVVADSVAGLPCDDVVDVTELRRRGRPVEFGHLMTVPRIRNRSVGKALMRHAVIHAVQRYDVTHIIGDFFADDGRRPLRSFYTVIGFVALCAPYHDDRFKGAPLSVVAVLDVLDAVRRCKANSENCDEALHYFFHDYHQYRMNG